MLNLAMVQMLDEPYLAEMQKFQKLKSNLIYLLKVFVKINRYEIRRIPATKTSTKSELHGQKSHPAKIASRDFWKKIFFAKIANCKNRNRKNRNFSQKSHPGH